MTIKIPVSAEFDGSSTDAQLREFEKRITELGQRIAGLNKLQFTPVAKGTIDSYKSITQQFDQLLKVSSGLSSRVKATQQGGVSFERLDWSKLYADAGQRSRQMQKAYEYVVGAAFRSLPTPDGVGQGGATPPGKPPAPPPVPPQPKRPNGPPDRNTITGAGLNVAQTGLRALGPAGSVGAGALGTAASAGFGAGLMGLVGGLVALGVGKAVGSIMEKVGDAQKELIGYDMLKRQVGDVSVSFDMLKNSVRASAAVLNTNFAEGQRLAMQFAGTANVGPGGAGTLGEEVAIGGGISRAYGLDLGQGVGFSATMRQFGVTSGPDDSRRVALLIGETIARASGFAKAGEILQHIANFTEQQTRLGLSSANVAGYGSWLSGAAGSGIPGLDPAGAAGLLSRVNAAVQRGGSEGAQNMYAYMGARMGIGPVEVDVLREQGAFGTGRSAFGKSSVYARFAEANGLGKSPLANDDKTTLTRVMDEVRSQYGDNPMLMVNALQNLLGIGTNQAMALSILKPSELGGANKRLARLGLDMSKVDGDGIDLLGKVESGNRAALAEIAKDFAGRVGKRAISQEEQDALDVSFKSGNDETLRDTLAQLASKYGQSENEGEKTRNTIEGVARVTQEFASALVPISNDIRAGVLYMAGKGGETSINDIRKSILESESKDRRAYINADYDARIKENNEKSAGLNNWGVAYIQETQAMLASGMIQRGSPELAERRKQEVRFGEEILELEKEEKRLREERNQALDAERAALKRRVEEMEEADRKKRAEEDARMGNGDGNTDRPTNLDERFPSTGQPSYAGAIPAANASGPDVSVTPQAGHIINPELAVRRGFRNNNPGNIEAGIGFQGEVGSDGRFARFKTPEHGYRALGKNLLTYQNKHGLRTVRQIISRWAPANENNTAAYIGQVSRQLGVGPDDPLNLRQEETLYGLVRAITGHENGGQLHSEETIRSGVGMALGGGPIPETSAASRGNNDEIFPSLTGTVTQYLELSPEAKQIFNKPSPIETKISAPRPN